MQAQTFLQLPPNPPDNFTLKPMRKFPVNNTAAMGSSISRHKADNVRAEAQGRASPAVPAQQVAAPKVANGLTNPFSPRPAWSPTARLPFDSNNWVKVSSSPCMLIVDNFLSMEECRVSRGVCVLHQI
jgi:hypothetical protein